MVWAKLDDEILDNEKVVNAGPLGFALHVAAITWSCRNLTDGFIPRSKVRSLLDFSGLRLVTGEKDVDPLNVAGDLADGGLWIEDEERKGFWLHDFLEYNPSRQEVLAKRDKEKEKKREQRASADRPAASERRPALDTPAESAVCPVGSPHGTPGGTPEVCPSGILSSPDPDPVPLQDSSNLLTITAPQLALAVPNELVAEKLTSALAQSGTSEVQPESRVTQGQVGAESSTRKTRSALRGSRLPADWEPSSETQVWARKEGVAEPCGRLLDEFRDYWVAVPGTKGVKTDWDATYRNRVRAVAKTGNAGRGRGRADTRQPLRDPNPEWLTASGGRTL